MIKVGSIIAVRNLHMIVGRLHYNDNGWLRAISGELIGATSDNWRIFDPTEVPVTVVTVH